MGTRKKLEARLGEDALQSLYTLRNIVLAVVAALAVGSVFVAIMGVNPLSAYYQLLIQPFTSIYSIGEVLAKATPLIIVGVGVAFAANCGLNNLGGEGQLYMGALGMVLVATSRLGAALGPWCVPLGMLLGAIFGAVWGGIAGWFKAYIRSNEIITTLMLNYIAVQFIAFLVHGPIREVGALMPATAMIPENMRLLRLFPGTRAHIGILIALACVLLYWVVLKRTRFGYNLRVVGKSALAASYTGVNSARYYFYSMCIAGAFAGLAGAIELCGVQFRLIESMVSGIGLTGMVVALVGLLNPIGIIAAGLLMSCLTAGAEVMQVASGVPVTLVNILQGLIVIFVLYSFSFKRKIKMSGTDAPTALSKKPASNAAKGG